MGKGWFSADRFQQRRTCAPSLRREKGRKKRARRRGGPRVDRPVDADLEQNVEERELDAEGERLGGVVARLGAPAAAARAARHVPGYVHVEDDDDDEEDGDAPEGDGHLRPTSRRARRRGVRAP